MSLEQEELGRAIDIQNEIIGKSEYYDAEAKAAFNQFSDQLKDLLQTRLNKAQVRSLTNDFLIAWKEGIGPDVELFWQKLSEAGIEWERRDELAFALEKGRFRRVDQGIAAYKHWPVLKDLEVIRQRFSLEELEAIELIIQKDLETRLAILQKCLQKKAIPKSQYLKFGECMAYFGQNQLFSKFFSDSQWRELYHIWENFS